MFIRISGSAPPSKRGLCFFCDVFVNLLDAWEKAFKEWQDGKISLTDAAKAL